MTVHRSESAKFRSSDEEIRVAAGAAIKQLVQLRGTNIISWSDIETGFIARNQRVKFASRAVGIFKPKELGDGAALSIKQVLPSRAGRIAPYDDRDLGSGIVAYSLERSGRDNHLLSEAFKMKSPLIFFRGVAEGRYEVIFPVFVGAIDLAKSEAIIVLADDNEAVETPNVAGMLNEPINKGYSFGERKTRLHQRVFRQRVLFAYGLKCALTGLPIPQLLEAVHIIPDAEGGEASIRNGIALSSLHHTAYELNLLGIDPDGRVHLSDTVRKTKDGPMFEHGLLQIDGTRLRMPIFESHRPNPDFLAVKFDEFRRLQT
jgi:putative restriction endonuclease